MIELLLVALATFIVVWAIVTYNGLISLRNLTEEGWSGIDVQLKRRTNLIPNLIETVKGYQKHEEALFDKITQARTQSMAANSPQQKSKIEGMLGSLLGRLFALAEDTPELKANENFLALQKQLADIEEQIQLARRYYNATVRNFNTKIETFPSLIIAKKFNFAQREFFEIEVPEQRATPTVKF